MFKNILIAAVALVAAIISEEKCRQKCDEKIMKYAKKRTAEFRRFDGGEISG